MQFIYLGEATFFEERIDELLDVAKSLEIKELCEAKSESEPSQHDQDTSSEKLKTEVQTETTDKRREEASEIKSDCETSQHDQDTSNECLENRNIEIPTVTTDDRTEEKSASKDIEKNNFNKKYERHILTEVAFGITKKEFMKV